MFCVMEPSFALDASSLSPRQTIPPTCNCKPPSRPHHRNRSPEPGKLTLVRNDHRGTTTDPAAMSEEVKYVETARADRSLWLM